MALFNLFFFSIQAVLTTMWFACHNTATAFWCIIYAEVYYDLVCFPFFQHDFALVFYHSWKRLGRGKSVHCTEHAREFVLLPGIVLGAQWCQDTGQSVFCRSQRRMFYWLINSNRAGLFCCFVMCNKSRKNVNFLCRNYVVVEDENGEQ